MQKYFDCHYYFKGELKDCPGPWDREKACLNCPWNNRAIREYAKALDYRLSIGLSEDEE